MVMPIYQVDAFSDRLFKGNPAAVMPLESWLDDGLLQSIAMENNLSETAFLVREAGRYALRWFTPTLEVDLCGHATLAAAHVLFEHLGHAGDEVTFTTRSGVLRVIRSGRSLFMDFPANELVPVEVNLAVCRALGATASEALEPVGSAGASLYVYEFEEDIAMLAPDFNALMTASPRAVIVSAPGEECDVVSRFFGPQVGINEDPVTGSAHCSIVPYWARRLHKQTLQCRQISPRGGELACELREGRVIMAGTAVTFMQGTIEVPLP